jgi:ATP-dependent Clp protease ATP-binding subunit ClpC
MTELPFTPEIQGVIENAKSLTKTLNRSSVDIDILFECFINELSLSCKSVLTKNKLIETLHLKSYQNIKNKRPHKTVSVNFDKKATEFIYNCEKTAGELFNLDYIPPEVVLINFLAPSTRPKAIADILTDDLFERIVSDVTLLVNDEDFNDSRIQSDDQGEDSENEYNFLDMFEGNPILSRFAENLNIKAANNKFDKIVDFDDKIAEIATILCRKKKPNAILVGPAGTGKTSLVEGLASKIVNGEAPELIANKVIYSLSLSSMVAGTQYRGQFEERLEKFVNEVKKYDNIILFIDEIHTLVGAGGTTENSLEASNILKPELARGTISCIGATTINEYTNTIKKDSALDRRFERVTIKEPSKFQMRQILPSITEYYEEFHGVEYTSEFINNVIDYCEKYAPNKFYPDKAIDVIDHCGAQAKVNYWEIDSEIKDLQNNILENIKQGKPYSKLMDLMNDKIEEWSEKMMKESPCVTVKHLKEFFSKKENPLCKSAVLDSMVSNLSKTFVGHRKVLKNLQKEIIISNFKLRKKQISAPNIYCLSGGQSTGKTFFCSLMKDVLEKDGANVLSYNGVHFSDDFAPYKIVSERNNNTSICEKIIIHTNSVIIIDDFHKVHPSAKTLFAQIFKEGRLQMNNGDIADFSNCKIFITSSVVETKSMGFNSDSENPVSAVFSELKQYFDCDIFLHKLNQRDIRRVLWHKLKEIKNALIINEVKFSFNFNFIKRFCSNISTLENLDSQIELKINKFITEKLLANEIEINLENLQETV